MPTNRSPKASLEGFHKRGQGPVHAWCVALDHKDPVVQVGNEAREAISFGMDEATGVLVFVLEQTQVTSDGHSLLDLDMPPSLIRTRFPEGEHADGNAGLWGVVSPSEDGPFVGAHAHPVSCLRLTLNVLDAPTEDPGVLAANALVTFGLQRDRGQGGVVACSSMVQN